MTPPKIVKHNGDTLREYGKDFYELTIEGDIYVGTRIYIQSICLLISKIHLYDKFFFGAESPTPIKACSHEFVDMGFRQSKLVCKHCDLDG